MLVTMRLVFLFSAMLALASPAAAERIYVQGTQPGAKLKTPQPPDEAHKPAGGLQDVLARVAPAAEAAKTDTAKTEPAKPGTEAPKSQAATVMPLKPAAKPAAPDYQFLPLLAANTDADTAAPILWPLLSSQILSAPHDHITRAVVYLHDRDRDAAAGLEQLRTMAGTAVAGDDVATIIIAPLFPALPDMTAFTSLTEDPSKSIAHWGADSWPFGTESETSGMRKGVSSFTALDMLLLYLAEPKFFPAMKTIVIAGYGSGGDMVQRYAVYGHAPDVLAAQKKPEIRFIVAAARSYAYLTNTRPKTGVESFAAPEVKDCPAYNDYPHGSDALNAYARWTTAQVARQAYADKSVAYLVGANDRGAGDPNCAAKLQGDSVKTRAVHYQRYVKSLFAEDAARQRLFLVPGTAADASVLWSSPCGASLLFADGNCP